MRSWAVPALPSRLLRDEPADLNSHPAQVDPPLVPDQRGDDAERRPAVGPTERLGTTGGFGTEETRVRCDADAAEVEPVGVPAGLNGDVGVGPLVGVARAGVVEQAELGVGEVEEPAAEGPGERGGAGAVGVV